MKKLYPFLLLPLLFSCSKKTPDNEPPQLTIISPVAGQTFKYPSNISVEASVSDNVMVQSVRVQAYDSVLYYGQIPSDGIQTFDKVINQKSAQTSQPVAVPQWTSSYKFIVSVVDQSGNRTVKDVTVKFNQ